MDLGGLPAQIFSADLKLLTRGGGDDDSTWSAKFLRAMVWLGCLGLNLLGDTDQDLDNVRFDLEKIKWAIMGKYESLMFIQGTDPRTCGSRGAILVKYLSWFHCWKLNWRGKELYHNHCRIMGHNDAYRCLL
jgi:hypothetical protein